MRNIFLDIWRHEIQIWIQLILTKIYSFHFYFFTYPKNNCHQQFPFFFWETNDFIAREYRHIWAVNTHKCSFLTLWVLRTRSFRWIQKMYDIRSIGQRLSINCNSISEVQAKKWVTQRPWRIVMCLQDKVNAGKKIVCTMLIVLFRASRIQYRHQIHKYIYSSGLTRNFFYYR